MSFWTRQGAAFGSGVPAGAAFGVAQSTFKDADASNVGQTFKDASTPTLSGIQAAPNSFGVTPTETDAYNAAHANDLNTDIGSTLIGKGMAWANKYVWSPGNDAVEALARASDDTQKIGQEEGGGIKGFFASFAAAPKAVSQEWHIARTQDNTAGQVAWSQFNPSATLQVPQIGKDGKVSGYKTEARRQWDDDEKRWVYPLLDDPAQQLEQDQYFKSGAQRWVTGTSDFIVSSATDPTLIVGKFAKGARSAREAFGAEDAEKAYKGAGLAKPEATSAEKVADIAPAADADVAPVQGAPGEKAEPTFKAAGWAENTEPTEDLAKVATVSGKARRFQKMAYHTSADLVDGITSGHTVAQYVKNPLIAQFADTGGIFTMAKRAVEIGGTREEQIARVQRALYAGAGSKKAYTDLASESPVSALELDALTSPDAAAARRDLMLQNMPHDQRLKILDDDDQLNKLTTAAQDEINDRVAQLDDLNTNYPNDLNRLRDQATLGTGEFGGKGIISKVPSSGIVGQRAVGRAIGQKVGQRGLEHAYSIQKSPLLPAVHFFTGDTIKGIVDLTGDNFGREFQGWANTVGKLARRTGDTEMLDILKDSADKALTAELGNGVARDVRLNAIRTVDTHARQQLVDRWSARLNETPETVGREIDALIDRRNSELTHAMQRARQATANNSPLSINTPDGVTVMPTQVRDFLAKIGSVGDDPIKIPKAVRTHLDQIGTGDLNLTAQQKARAISTAQFQSHASLTDWNRVERSLEALHKSNILKPAVKAGRVIGHAGAVTADYMSDLWKFGVLFRPIAYPLRNQLDTQARVMARLGPVRYSLQAAAGMGNFTFNNLKRVPRIDAAQFGKRLSLHQLAEQAEDTLRNASLSKADRAAWQDTLDRTQASLSLSPEDFKQEMLRDLPTDSAGKSVVPADQRGKTLIRWTDAKHLQGTRWRMGPGGAMLEQSDRWAAAYDSLPDFLRQTDELDAENVFAGWFQDTSSDLLGTNRVEKAAAGGLKPLNTTEERTGHWNTLSYDPSRPEMRDRWNDGYLTYVNKQVRNDAVNRMIMQGQPDSAILAWLRTDGSSYWKTFREGAQGEAKYATPGDLLVDRHGTINRVLPTTSSRQKALAADVSAEDISPTFKNAERPAIPVEGKRARNVPKAVQFTEMLQRGTRGYFNLASTLPENMMGRHPLYMAAKRDYLAEAAENLGKDGRDTITLAQARKINEIAEVRARRDVAKIVFDTTNKTPFAQSTRWLFPFYGAWQDTLVKWARIQGENPEAVPGLVHAFTIPSRVFQVQDDNGNIVRANGDVVDPVTGDVLGTGYDPLKGHWVIGLPKAIQEATGAENIKLNRNSLNVIFQGEPFWLPGPGPVVTIGVQQVANRLLPEVFGGIDPAEAVNNPFAKWAAPFGLSDTNVTDAALPSWMKSMSELIQHDDVWKNKFQQQMYDISGQVARGEIPKLTKAQIQTKAENNTRNWFLLRLLGTQSPVSTIPGDPLEFYRDRWHEYLNKYPTFQDASDAFDKDYPEFGNAKIALSVNQTGIQATIPAQKAADKYMPAIKANPSVGWAIVGPDNVSGYNSDVYTEQKALGWRTQQDPQTALDQEQANAGWNAYNAYMIKVNSWLTGAGLTSLRQKGAEPLAAQKQQFIDQLSEKNPAWKQSFASAGAGDSQVKFLDQMTDTIKSYPNLGKRDDMVTLQKYMATRAKMREWMEGAGVRTLATTTNPDGTEHYADTAGGALASWWDTYSAQLYDQAGPVFQAMYDRSRLADDDLSNGVSN